MKKLILCITLLCTVMVTGIVTVNAYSGSQSDSRVDMIWWSQGGGSNMYWTGVTNKLSYDKFAPCVGANNSEYACGAAVGQSSYGEHGRWLDNSAKVVVHGLAAESGGYTGPLQYPINVNVKDSDR